MSKEKTIGLAEMIEQVKQELLSTTLGQSGQAPFLFVSSVEVELQVTAKREGTGGVKVNVVPVGGAEIGGSISRNDVHTVKVSLSPLFDKERLLEIYRAHYPDGVPYSVKQSLDALFKGGEDAPPSVI